MFNLSSTGIVNGTLFLLAGFSIATWTVIFFKVYQYWRIARDNRAYCQVFWRASSLGEAVRLSGYGGPAARLAQAGFRALSEAAPDADDLSHRGNRQDIFERSLRQQLRLERRAMESGLALLASIGSTSPFVGLFGTVWGIMNALRDITRSGSASLDVVAGPIGEALTATAIGIAVAIPAVLAYNFFLRRLRLAAAELEDYAADLQNLALQTVSPGEKAAALPEARC